MLEAEIEELLREFMNASQAESVLLGPENRDLPAGGSVARLGQGGLLSATFTREQDAQAAQSRREMLERTARALRACLRRHQADTWPSLSLPSTSPDTTRLILARIQQFLQGLVDTSKLTQVVLLRRGKILSAAYPLAELDESRLELLVRQLDRAARDTPGSAHGELIRDDVYGCTFWYGAALIGFSDAAYSLDFVRHRYKMVARELAHLLNMLDDDPRGPAKAAPPPAT